MYRNILVPISFEDDEQPMASLEIAQRLAEDEAKITLLHVIEDVPSYAINYMPEGYMTDLRAAVLEEMRALAGGVEAAIADGAPGPSILQWIDDHGIDCVVMASHRPGLTDYFLGSTAARVVRHAPCSVHVLRSPA